MNFLTLIKRRITRSYLNVAFTAYCFLSPVLGSTVSFIFNGGGLWALVETAISRRRFYMPRPVIAQTISIYLYFFSYIASSIYNFSIYNDFSKLISLVTFIFFPFCYVTLSISEKKQLSQTVIIASMAACFGAVCLAIVQYYWLDIRAEGGAGNAIVFATVACLAAMTCIAGHLSDLVQWNRALVFAALAGTVAILLSGSRIIWLAAPVVAGVLLFIYRKNFSSSRMRKLILTAVAIVTVIGIFGAQIVMTRSKATLSDIASMAAKGDYDTPIGLRVALWKIGLEEFRQSPIFGHGAGATKALINNDMLEDFGLDRGFNHFHNGFLTALVEGGLLGMASLASIFLVAAFNAVKVLRDRRDPSERFGAAMVLIAVTTYLIAGLTGILVGHDILDAVLMIFLIVGTYLGCGRIAESGARTGPHDGTAAR